MSNDIYTFSLSYLEACRIQRLELVLKAYRKDAQEKCLREGQILRALEHKKFPAPHLYKQEMNKELFGAPFIIMEKVKGMSLEDYLKKHKKEKPDVIKRFAEYLAFLHNLRWEDSGLNFLRHPADEYDFARKQIVMLRNLKATGNTSRSFEWVTDWLESNVSLCPCYRYSLLYGDMHLANFYVSWREKLVALDWEYPEVGDALRDVALAYHNIVISGLRTTNRGKKMGEYFIQQYIKSSNRKIDYDALHFYIVLAALLEALFYRFDSSQALNPFFVKQILGSKYVPAFPLVWWYFRSKFKRLERFLEEELTVKSR